MRIQTSRFGEIEIAPNDTLEFAEGLLGFGQLRKFVLLDDPNDEIFAWLQSCDEAGIAFPVLEPELFMPNYKVEPSKSSRGSFVNNHNNPVRPNADDCKYEGANYFESENSHGPTMYFARQ
jgi:FliW protein